MKRLSLSSALCALPLSLGACGDDRAPLVATDADTTADTDTAGPDDDATVPDADANDDAPSLSGEVTGTWASLETQTAIVTLESLGQMEQVSRSLYLARHDGTKVTFELCDWSTTDDTGLYTTLMSPALLKSLLPLDRAYTVTANDNGFAYVVAQGTTLRGVKLDTPDSDPMPTSKDDGRIFDQDEDGKPGVSLVIQGTLQGELHVIHRHKAALTGRLITNDRIEGRAAWTTEQIILGSNPPTLEEQKPVAVTHPDPAKSHFEMVKINDTDTCADIVAKRGELFPE
jgi:hypothetical protein